MKSDDQNHSRLLDLERRIRALETGDQLGNAKVTRGAVIIASEEGLQIGEADDPTGSQKVYGTLEITGTLRGDGTINWEGPSAFKGRVDVTGFMHLMGAGRVISSSQGDTTHSMQMYFDGPAALGRIVAFGVPMELRAWASSVRLNENGLSIEGGGGVITMSADGIQIVSAAGSSGPWIELKGDGIYFHNLPDS